MLTVLSGPDLFYRYPNGDEVHKVVAVFLADEVTGAERPCGVEAAEVRRFPLSDLPESLDPVDRLTIEHYLTHRAPPT